MTSLHGADAFDADVAASMIAFVAERIHAGAPLGRTATAGDIAAVLAGSITDQGLGGEAAWQRFLDGVAANTVGLDSDRFLAFIPVSPSAASIWMDTVVGGTSFSAESWLEAPGAVAAENQTLRWLCDVIGLPRSAGGCFMTGGSICNLSALAVGRASADDRRHVLIADSAHSSLRNSLDLLGLVATTVDTGDDGRMTGDAAAGVMHDGVGIVVGSAGSTNGGIVDDIDGLADVAASAGAWLHVDGAYGLAAMLLDECRPLFAGIERADSVVIDPHKWLFGTQGSGALLYREPELAKQVHRQRGPYLDVLHDDDVWNPSDYGYQLTRRATGLPLWFALATHGVDAHRRAIRAGVELAARAARQLATIPGVRIVAPPQLSVVLFERDGWDAGRWRRWAADLLAAGTAFVAPTTWRGRAVGRLVFMHPSTPHTLIDEIADSLR
jgi:glutamate/tyrosine decarboxylase-like PLP-dependent enzyme